MKMNAGKVFIVTVMLGMQAVTIGLLCRLQDLKHADTTSEEKVLELDPQYYDGKFHVIQPFGWRTD